MDSKIPKKNISNKPNPFGNYSFMAAQSARKPQKVNSQQFPRSDLRNYDDTKIETSKSPEYDYSPDINAVAKTSIDSISGGGSELADIYLDGKNPIRESLLSNDKTSEPTSHKSPYKIPNSTTQIPISTGSLHTRELTSDSIIIPSINYNSLENINDTPKNYEKNSLGSYDKDSSANTSSNKSSEGHFDYPNVSIPDFYNSSTKIYDQDFANSKTEGLALHLPIQSYSPDSLLSQNSSLNSENHSSQSPLSPIILPSSLDSVNPIFKSKTLSKNSPFANYSLLASQKAIQSSIPSTYKSSSILSTSNLPNDSSTQHSNIVIPEIIYSNGHQDYVLPEATPFINNHTSNKNEHPIPLKKSTSLDNSLLSDPKVPFSTAALSSIFQNHANSVSTENESNQIAPNLTSFSEKSKNSKGSKIDLNSIKISSIGLSRYSSSIPLSNSALSKPYKPTAPHNLESQSYHRSISNSSSDLNPTHKRSSNSDPNASITQKTQKKPGINDLNSSIFPKSSQTDLLSTNFKHISKSEFDIGSSVSIDHSGEFIVKSVYIEFKIISNSVLNIFSEYRLDQEPDLNSFMGKGANKKLDSVLETLGSLSKLHTQIVVELLLIWRKTSFDKLKLAFQSSHSHSALVINERRSLSTVYLLCRALNEVSLNIDPNLINEELGNKIESLVFAQIKDVDPLTLQYSSNRRRIQELYAQIAGNISKFRFASISDRFIAALEQFPPTNKENIEKNVVLIRSFRFLKLVLHPMESLEESCNFLLSCAKFFSRVSGSLILKHTWAVTLSELLMPLVGEVGAEINIPSFVQAIEIIYSKAAKMSSRAHHIPVAYPLVSATLCLSRQDFFTSKWQIHLENCIQKLKDKQHRPTAMDSICRIMWVYMFRYPDSQNSVNRKIDSLFRIFFPVSNRRIWIKSIGADYLMYSLVCASCFNLDFVFKAHIHSMLQLGILNSHDSHFFNSPQNSDNIIEYLHPQKAILAYKSLIEVAKIFSSDGLKYPKFLPFINMLLTGTSFDSPSQLNSFYKNSIFSLTSPSLSSGVKASFSPKNESNIKIGNSASTSTGSSLLSRASDGLEGDSSEVFCYPHRIDSKMLPPFLISALHDASSVMSIYFEKIQQSLGEYLLVDQTPFAVSKFFPLDNSQDLNSSNPAQIIPRESNSKKTSPSIKQTLRSSKNDKNTVGDQKFYNEPSDVRDFSFADLTDFSINKIKRSNTNSTTVSYYSQYLIDKNDSKSLIPSFSKERQTSIDLMTSFVSSIIVIPNLKLSFSLDKLVETLVSGILHVDTDYSSNCRIVLSTLASTNSDMDLDFSPSFNKNSWSSIDLKKVSILFRICYFLAKIYRFVNGKSQDYLTTGLYKLLPGETDHCYSCSEKKLPLSLNVDKISSMSYFRKCFDSNQEKTHKGAGNNAHFSSFSHKHGLEFNSLLSSSVYSADDTNSSIINRFSAINSSHNVADNFIKKRNDFISPKIRTNSLFNRQDSSHNDSTQHPHSAGPSNFAPNSFFAGGNIRCYNNQKIGFESSITGPSQSHDSESDSDINYRRDIPIKTESDLNSFLISSFIPQNSSISGNSNNKLPSANGNVNRSNTTKKRNKPVSNLVILNSTLAKISQIHHDLGNKSPSDWRALIDIFESIGLSLLSESSLSLRRYGLKIFYESSNLQFNLSNILPTSNKAFLFKSKMSNPSLKDDNNSPNPSPKTSNNNYNDSSNKNNRTSFYGEPSGLVSPYFRMSHFMDNHSYSLSEILSTTGMHSLAPISLIKSHSQPHGEVKNFKKMFNKSEFVVRDSIFSILQSHQFHDHFPGLYEEVKLSNNPLSLKGGLHATKFSSNNATNQIDQLELSFEFPFTRNDHYSGYIDVLNLGNTFDPHLESYSNFNDCSLHSANSAFNESIFTLADLSYTGAGVSDFLEFYLQLVQKLTKIIPEVVDASRGLICKRIKHIHPSIVLISNIANNKVLVDSKKSLKYTASNFQDDHLDHRSTYSNGALGFSSQAYSNLNPTTFEPTGHYQYSHNSSNSYDSSSRYHSSLGDSSTKGISNQISDLQVRYKIIGFSQSILSYEELIKSSNEKNSSTNSYSVLEENPQIEISSEDRDNCNSRNSSPKHLIEQFCFLMKFAFASLKKVESKSSSLNKTSSTNSGPFKAEKTHSFKGLKKSKVKPISKVASSILEAENDHNSGSNSTVGSTNILPNQKTNANSLFSLGWARKLAGPLKLNFKNEKIESIPEWVSIHQLIDIIFPFLSCENLYLRLGMVDVLSTLQLEYFPEIICDLQDRCDLFLQVSPVTISRGAYSSNNMHNNPEVYKGTEYEQKIAFTHKNQIFDTNSTNFKYQTSENPAINVIKNSGPQNKLHGAGPSNLNSISPKFLPKKSHSLLMDPKKVERIRLSLCMIYKYSLIRISKDSTALDSFFASENRQPISMLISFVKETTKFLNSFMAINNFEYQALRFHFCGLVESMYYLHLLSHKNAGLNNFFASSEPLEKNKTDHLSPHSDLKQKSTDVNYSEIDWKTKRNSFAKSFQSSSGTSPAKFTKGTSEGKIELPILREERNRRLSVDGLVKSRSGSIDCLGTFFNFETKRDLYKLFESWNGYGSNKNFYPITTSQIEKASHNFLSNNSHINKKQIIKLIQEESENLKNASIRALSILLKVDFLVNPSLVTTVIPGDCFSGNDSVHFLNSMLKSTSAAILDSSTSVVLIIEKGIEFFVESELSKKLILELFDLFYNPTRLGFGSKKLFAERKSHNFFGPKKPDGEMSIDISLSNVLVKIFKDYGIRILRDFDLLEESLVFGLFISNLKNLLVTSNGNQILKIISDYKLSTHESEKLSVLLEKNLYGHSCGDYNLKHVAWTQVVELFCQNIYSLNVRSEKLACILTHLIYTYSSLRDDHRKDHKILDFSIHVLSSFLVVANKNSISSAIFPSEDPKEHILKSFIYISSIIIDYKTELLNQLWGSLIKNKIAEVEVVDIELVLWVVESLKIKLNRSKNPKFLITVRSILYAISSSIDPSEACDALIDTGFQKLSPLGFVPQESITDKSPTSKRGQLDLKNPHNYKSNYNYSDSWMPRYLDLVSQQELNDLSSGLVVTDAGFGLLLLSSIITSKVELLLSNFDMIMNLIPLCGSLLFCHDKNVDLAKDSAIKILTRVMMSLSSDCYINDYSVPDDIFRDSKSIIKLLTESTNLVILFSETQDFEFSRSMLPRLMGNILEVFSWYLKIKFGSDNNVFCENWCTLSLRYGSSCPVRSVASSNFKVLSMIFTLSNGHNRDCVWSLVPNSDMVLRLIDRLSNIINTKNPEIIEFSTVVLESLLGLSKLIISSNLSVDIYIDILCCSISIMLTDNPTVYNMGLEIYVLMFEKVKSFGLFNNAAKISIFENSIGLRFNHTNDTQCNNPFLIIYNCLTRGMRFPEERSITLGSIMELAVIIPIKSSEGTDLNEGVFLQILSMLLPHYLMVLELNNPALLDKFIEVSMLKPLYNKLQSTSRPYYQISKYIHTMLEYPKDQVNPEMFIKSVLLSGFSDLISSSNGSEIHEYEIYSLWMIQLDSKNDINGTSYSGTNINKSLYEISDILHCRCLRSANAIFEVNYPDELKNFVNIIESFPIQIRVYKILFYLEFMLEFKTSNIKSGLELDIESEFMGPIHNLIHLTFNSKFGDLSRNILKSFMSRLNHKSPKTGYGSLLGYGSQKSSSDSVGHDSKSAKKVSNAPNVSNNPDYSNFNKIDWRVECDSIIGELSRKMCSLIVDNSLKMIVNRRETSPSEISSLENSYYDSHFNSVTHDGSAIMDGRFGTPVLEMGIGIPDMYFGNKYVIGDYASRSDGLSIVEPHTMDNSNLAVQTKRSTGNLFSHIDGYMNPAPIQPLDNYNTSKTPIQNPGWVSRKNNKLDSLMCDLDSLNEYLSDQIHQR
ncbi:Cell polarity protein mor2 [Smittium mucronatum]|uniref:Cell polarity protein mor2 n=1 Tax=Smittium mucronatum TaxID=133383 RepID=A0A1R0GVV9_9FUNG|nr:Cell polarity protein mor2 [Smittium mucronatum]